MNNSDNIWAYLQGELDEETRLEFETLLRTDTQLLKKFKEAEWLNRKMKSRFAAEELDEQGLIDRIEQELIRSESSTSSAESTPGSSKAPSVIPFPGLSSGAKGLLALAACLLIIMGVRPYPASTISSFRSELGERSFRSNTPAFQYRALPLNQRYYTDQQLIQVAEGMNETLTEKLAHEFTKPGYAILFYGRDEYDVTVTLGEMRAGQLFMHVSMAQQGTTDKPVEWERYFKSMEACETSLEKTTDELLALLRE